MRVRQIAVGMGRTYNMGNYESFRIDGSVTVDVDDDETPAEAAVKAFPILREQMKATFREFKPKPKESK